MILFFPAGLYVSVLVWNVGRAKTKAKEQSTAITKRDGLIVVSFFLPVIVNKVSRACSPGVQRSHSWIVPQLLYKAFDCHS